MKKPSKKRISRPEELNAYLESTTPFPWIAFSLAILALIGFFLWGSIAKIPMKLKGEASLVNGSVTLHIEEKRLPECKVGQKVYIAEEVGEIIAIQEDGQPIVSNFANLPDGKYEYTILLKEVRPIEYFTTA